MTPTLRSYTGRLRNIIIAIDFGTTFSGVSYAVLEPGAPPQIRSVTSFPGQKRNASSARVPTVLYYDPQGRVRATGAESNDPDIMNEDEFEEWTKLERLKPLLRPKETHEDLLPPQLPPGKTLPMVLGDFLKYMKACAEDFIRKNHVGGHILCREVAGRVDYVLSHPNGWDGFRRRLMRAGAINGGLVPDTETGRGRVHFVSEGEASFHWCVESGLASGSLKVGCDVVVADAGEGTIDVSAFRVTNVMPLKLKETRQAECRLAGSVFVTHAFDRYIREHLKNSMYGDTETIERLVAEFERKSRRIFRETSPGVTIQFGRPTDPPEPAYGIKGGRLTLPKDVVLTFFEQSVTHLVDAVNLQSQGNTHTTVFLVGEFAASPYLPAELERRTAGCSVTIKRAESHTAKAVADGAVAYFLNRSMDGRFANNNVVEAPSATTSSHTTETNIINHPTLKCIYGVFHNVVYDSENLEHIGRASAAYIEPITGSKRVSGKFYHLLEKGASLEETTIRRECFSDPVDEKNRIFHARFVLYCYRGSKEGVGWRDEDPRNFRPVCAFSSGLPKAAIKLHTPPVGPAFLQAMYAVVVTPSLTGISCHIEWTDDSGTVQRGRMTAVA